MIEPNRRKSIESNTGSWPGDLTSGRQQTQVAKITVPRFENSFMLPAAQTFFRYNSFFPFTSFVKPNYFNIILLRGGPYESSQHTPRPSCTNARREASASRGNAQWRREPG